MERQKKGELCQFEISYESFGDYYPGSGCYLGKKGFGKSLSKPQPAILSETNKNKGVNTRWIILDIYLVETKQKITLEQQSQCVGS